MQNLTIKALALGVALPFTMLAGCSAPTAGQVVTSAPAATTAQAEPTDGAVVVEDDEESASPSAAPTVAALGSTVRVGEWEVKVTKVTKNANRLIKHANTYNDKAEDQYMLVEYKAKYVGEERKGRINASLTWSFTDAEETVLDEASVVTPADDKDKPTVARLNGSVSLDVAFDVDPKKMIGGIISVEDAFTSEFADWQL